MFTCKICGIKRKQLHQHIKKTHNMDVAEYKRKFNVDKVSDVNTLTPENRYNGWSVSYWMDRGLTEEEAKTKVANLQKMNALKSQKRDHRKYSNRCIEYWIDKGMSEIEAEQKVSELQAKWSALSPKFSGHLHSIESRKAISKTMKKYAKKVGTAAMVARFGSANCGTSDAEKQCIDELEETLGIAFFRNKPILGGKYRPDARFGNIIIEYYGDYWHGNPSVFDGTRTLPTGITLNDKRKKDELRIQEIKGAGYDVYIIWESDWNDNKDFIKLKLLDVFK